MQDFAARTNYYNATVTHPLRDHHQQKILIQLRLGRHKSECFKSTQTNPMQCSQGQILKKAATKENCVFYQRHLPLAAYLHLSSVYDLNHHCGAAAVLVWRFGTKDDCSDLTPVITQMEQNKGIGSLLGPSIRMGILHMFLLWPCNSNLMDALLCQTYSHLAVPLS